MTDAEIAHAFSHMFQPHTQVRNNMAPETPALVISNADFDKNNAIDLSPYIKKLQSLDYVPWGVSLTLMRKFDPNLAVGFEENSEGQPFFFVAGRGAYLKPYIYDKVSGKRTPSLFFPVRDNRRKASEDIMLDTLGNQYQRAVSKVIAQEVGIGWSLYSRIDESLEELGNPSPVSEPTRNVTSSPAPEPKTRKKDEVVAPIDNSLLDF